MNNYFLNNILGKVEYFFYHRKIEKAWQKKLYVNWLNDIIKEILKNRPGAFVDVGASIGSNLLRVKWANEDNEYFGFEPNSKCCFYINELIEFNNFKNCKIIPVGLSNKNEVLKLFLKNDSANSFNGSASIIEGFRDKSFYSSEVYVPVFEGDYILNILNINSVSIIKIDVEGAELEVIQGLRGSISKYQPYIICEILPAMNDSTEVKSLRPEEYRKERQNLLEKILAEEKYKIFRILDDGELIPLDQIGVYSDLSLSEYIFIPETETKDNQFLRSKNLS